MMSEAASQYRLLEQQFPDSEEAATAHVSLGLVLLDQLGDPSRALEAFDRYLADRNRTALREQSLVGRARALGKLGNHEEEKRAWATLLREYPTSLSAEAARSALAK
jgi:TolA-binding protein